MFFYQINRLFFEWLKFEFRAPTRSNAQKLKSQKLSVFGLINSDCKFYSHTTTGSLTSKVLIGYLDEFVQGITKRTILVLDNAP
ncbi:hypothetical protein EZS27_044320, partial [termite gut metagenome]